MSWMWYVEPMGNVINASVILAGEPEREISLGKLRHRKERKLKLIE
jgi:hypothetical protein